MAKPQQVTRRYVISAEDQQALIDELELLLKRTRSGEIAGLAIAMLLTDTRMGTYVGGACAETPILTAGLLQRLQFDLHMQSKKIPGPTDQK